MNEQMGKSHISFSLGGAHTKTNVQLVLSRHVNMF